MEPFTRFYPDDDDPWGGRLAVRREKTPVGAGSALLLSPFPSNSGSRAMLAATRRASSAVRTFASEPLLNQFGQIKDRFYDCKEDTDYSAVDKGVADLKPICIGGNAHAII